MSGIRKPAVILADSMEEYMASPNPYKNPPKSKLNLLELDFSFVLSQTNRLFLGVKHRKIIDRHNCKILFQSQKTYSESFNSRTFQFFSHRWICNADQSFGAICQRQVSKIYNTMLGGYVLSPNKIKTLQQAV